MDEGGCLYILSNPEDNYIEPETDSDSDDETVHILDQVTAHTEFGEQLSTVGFEVYEDENNFDSEIYSREDVLNIFPADIYPAFTAEIKLAFEEGEMISNIDLYEIMGMYGLSIPGFELIYDSSTNPQDSFNTSFQDIISVPPPLINTSFQDIISILPPLISTPIITNLN